MSKGPKEKTLEILVSTEKVADEILVIKQNLVKLDEQRQHMREAKREIETTMANEKSVWITIGSTMVKMPREEALNLITRDQQKIQQEMNVISSGQKILVNKLRDLEMLPDYVGTKLKPLDPKTLDIICANMPIP